MPKKFIRDYRRNRNNIVEEEEMKQPIDKTVDTGNSLTSSVTVGAGTSFEVPVSGYEGCVLVWSFKTNGGDIGFGVGFTPDPPSPVNYASQQDDDEGGNGAIPPPPPPPTASNNNGEEEITLLPTSRCDSDVREISGTMQVAQSGTVILRWDNGYSYFNSKNLTYTVELEEPLGGQLFNVRPLGTPEVPKVIFVLGGPGAGKGTQCGRLAKKYGFLHVSAGDLLRAERSNPASQYGELISTFIKEGKIVPVEITVALLWRAIRESARKVILVDGFPRNQDNVDGWLRKINVRAEIVGVLDFQVPDEIMVSRLLSRGKSSGRDDDNEVSIKKRLATFHTETQPILDFFSAKKKLIAIDGNRDADVVFNDVESRLMKLFSLPRLDDFILAAPKNKKSLKVVLGTMTMGGNGLNESDTKEIIKQFLSSESSAIEIDTARMYAQGDTEKVLGRAFSSLSPAFKDQVKIATKVNPFPGFGNSLTPTSIATQFGESLNALKVNDVGILYLHAPDMVTPLEATLEACDALHRKGKFKELGLSNFPSWLVVHAYHLCTSRGWVKPTVYQGMYNCLTRDVEKELFPSLRSLNIRFYAYNPLAGGLLTSGRYLENSDEIPEKGRFSSENRSAQMYRDRYWKPSYFAALSEIDKACRQFNITIQDAAMRWLTHHSQLRFSRSDAIIVGGSTVHHLKSNIDSARLGGPLPLPVVVCLEKCWNSVKGDCPKYFRP